MKLNEMIDIIKEAHPNTTHNRIIKILNQAQDEFCTDSRINDGSFTISGGTVVDQRFYTLDASILTISDVFVADERAQRLSEKPDKEDEDLA